MDATDRPAASREKRARNKNRHIFYHVGPVMVELVEQEDGRRYPDVINPKSENVTTKGERLAARDKLAHNWRPK